MSGNADKLCIDLCSGLGGFSRAFVDAGWEVVTVDIDPKFEPTLTADILKLTADQVCKATKRGDFGAYRLVVVLASPPCERFSLAATGKGNTFFPGKGVRKALEMVGACLELIEAIRPDAWILENPKARLRWFIGKPWVTVSYQNFGGKHFKETDLWGSFPLPMVDADRASKKSWMDHPGYREMDQVERQRYRHHHWGNQTGDAAKRAIVPEGLSQAVLKGIEATQS